MLKRLFKIAGVAEDPHARQAKLHRDLMRHEARIGGRLFGPVPKGVRRDFFCLDEYTWIWHEEWMEGGQRKVRTTRYDVRPNGIVKAQDGKHYRMISREEAKKLLQAVRAYEKRIDKEIYQPVLG